MADKPEPKRPRGRPPKEVPKLGASPETIARRIFSAVKRPDPTIRKARYTHASLFQGAVL